MKKLLATAAVIGSSATLMSIPAPASAITVSGTVPNMYVRTCSYITRRCTGWYQTNGRYNPYVGSTYTTRWTWYWI